MAIPDYEALMAAAIAAAANDKKWIGAKYEGIKIVSNTAVGKVGQTFVEALCAALGLPFTVAHECGHKAGVERAAEIADEGYRMWGEPRCCAAEDIAQAIRSEADGHG